MSRRRDRPETAADRALREVYARIPAIACKRQCADSCGPIGMSRREDQKIRKAGYRIPPMDEARDANAAALAAGAEPIMCPALRDGSCQVHPQRPAICRLWGVCEDMRCPHGCVPEGGRWLTRAEMMNLITEALYAGGSDITDGWALEDLLSDDGIWTTPAMNRIVARAGQPPSGGLPAGLRRPR